jgi:hypothetical protein
MTTDRDSQLPVRSQQDIHERLQSKIVDSNDPSLQMQVDADGNAHVEVHGNEPATGADTVLRLSKTGAPNTDGCYDAVDNIKPSHSGMVVHNRATTPSDSDLVKRVTGVSDGTVHCADVSLHDEDGKPYSKTNPIHVEMAPASGERIRNFLENVDVAKDGSVQHNYTVAAYALDLSRVECSSSGKAKFTLQISLDGLAFNTIGVMFNSTANPNCVFDLGAAPNVVPVGGVVRLIKVNRDHDVCSMYSTIVGVKTLSSAG